MIRPAIHLSLCNLMRLPDPISGAVESATWIRSVLSYSFLVPEGNLPGNGGSVSNSALSSPAIITRWRLMLLLGE